MFSAGSLGSSSLMAIFRYPYSCVSVRVTFLGLCIRSRLLVLEEMALQWYHVVASRLWVHRKTCRSQMIAKSKCTILFGGARTWKDHSLARRARPCEVGAYAMIYVL